VWLENQVTQPDRIVPKEVIRPWANAKEFCPSMVGTVSMFVESFSTHYIPSLCELPFFIFTASFRRQDKSTFLQIRSSGRAGVLTRGKVVKGQGMGFSSGLWAQLPQNLPFFLILFC
jgi:hypothetical protein